MTFLPMVERELRAASRRRMTYWSRWLAAAGATMMFGLFYTASTVVRAPASFSSELFGGLVGVGMFYCLFEAIRTGADCLSREKREGTIGLLFLTDLSGMDVVLGKLAAAALQSLYALMAVLPVLAVTIFLGGVTFGMVVRETLALLNFIFFAYALVIWCSARAYGAFRAVLSAFIWMAVVVAGTIFVDVALVFPNKGETPIFSLISPALCVYIGHEDNFLSHAGAFWASLGLVHAESWLLVWLAAKAIRRNWEVAPALVPLAEKPRRGFLGIGRRASASAGFRKRYLDRNPIEWLVRCMERNTGRRMPWIIGVLAFTLFFCSVGWDKSSIQSGWMIGLAPLLYLIYLIFPARAGRLFAQMRETGSWELLGCTPLKPQEIASGIWRGLRPALIRLLIAGAVIKLGVYWEGIIRTYVYGSPSDELWPICLELALALVIFGLDMAALGWVSVWIALKARGLMKTVLSTLILVMILPNAAMAVLLWFLMVINQGQFSTNEMLFWKLVFLPIVMIIKDVVLIWWARDNFRLFCRNMAELGHS